MKESEEFGAQKGRGADVCLMKLRSMVLLTKLKISLIKLEIPLNFFHLKHGLGYVVSYSLENSCWGQLKKGKRKKEKYI